MIDYTEEEEVNILSDMIKLKTHPTYSAIHIVRELRRKYHYGFTTAPYITPDANGSTDAAYFIQQVPFEDLPKYVNNNRLRLLLEWRLRIGK